MREKKIFCSTVQYSTVPIANCSLNGTILMYSLRISLTRETKTSDGLLYDNIVISYKGVYPKHRTAYCMIILLYHIKECIEVEDMIIGMAIIEYII